MPEDTPAAPLPPCPFVAGPMIRDPRLFVGREAELQFLARHLAGAQPTSVNVVGQRRIGKSSLLYHFYQTWAQRVPDPRAAVVVYLSLQDARAQTELALYRAMLSPLLGQLDARRQATLRQALAAGQTSREGFATAMRHCRRAGLLPVFCLDEFEAVMERPDRFDDGFYDAWRALMDECAFMLVLASKRPLATYRRRHRLTSAFFNQGQSLTLRELIEGEARDLVRLPASTVTGAPAALSLEEQRLARHWGGRHPYRLQLAAKELWHARQDGRDAAWARARFDEQATQLPRRRWPRPRLWRIPEALGRWAWRLGETRDKAQNILWGTIILIGAIVLIVLAILRVIPVDQILDGLRDWLGRLT
jgi:hypothetical protein